MYLLHVEVECVVVNLSGWKHQRPPELFSAGRIHVTICRSHPITRHAFYLIATTSACVVRIGRHILRNEHMVMV